LFPAAYGYLLAGTGYGGSQADIVQQYLPDHTSLSYGYDVFGDQTKVTDQLGRITTRTYDGMGRLLTQTLPADSTNGDAALTDFSPTMGLACGWRPPTRR
jgi:YD repeat-containing protein